MAVDLHRESVLASGGHGHLVAGREGAVLIVSELRGHSACRATDVHSEVLTTASEGIFPDVVIAARLEAWLFKLGIALRTGLVPAKVIDRVLVGQDGRRVPFDLLVMEPPQRGVAVVRDSGLGKRPTATRPTRKGIGGWETPITPTQKRWGGRQIEWLRKSFLPPSC